MGGGRKTFVKALNDSDWNCQRIACVICWNCECDVSFTLRIYRLFHPILGFEWRFEFNPGARKHTSGVRSSYLNLLVDNVSWRVIRPVKISSNIELWSCVLINSDFSEPLRNISGINLNCVNSSRHFLRDLVGKDNSTRLGLNPLTSENLIFLSVK